MDSTKSTATVLMTFLVAAVLGALAWFFYFNPTITEIGDIESEVSAQEDLNETLQIQVDQLAADFERLPEIRQEIDTIAQDVPPVEDEPGFIRTIAGISDAYDNITLERLSVGVPTVIENSITLARAAAVFEEGSYVEQLEFEGLIGSSFSLEVLGPQEEVRAMLEELQTGTHRYFLIEVYAPTALEPTEASGARPEIGEDWISASMQGWSFTVIQPDIDPTLKPGPDGEVPTRTSLADQAENDDDTEGAGASTSDPSVTPSPSE